MIEALVMLKGTDASPVGRDRIRLLEAVGREGSISAGARAVGLSYKVAWDGLDAMARLFGRPLLETRAGGRAGGGARLTPAGTRIIASFGRLEAELARAARLFDPLAAAMDGDPAARLVRTSARNALPGTIEAFRPHGLTVDVVLVLADGGSIVARVTDASRHHLDLHVGGSAVALVKAPFVKLGPAASGAPTENAFAAIVRRTTIAGRDAEAVVDIDAGRHLTASLPARRAKALGLTEGQPVGARFSAADVILAVD